MKKSVLFCAFFGLFTSFSAYAGAESHGGQVVYCPGKPLVTLDYFQATLPTQSGGAPQLEDISNMSSEEVLSFISSRLQNYEIFPSYFRARVVLGPIGNWLEGNLQNIPDSEPAYTLPEGCELKQVAVRQDSTMYVDPSLLALLSPAQVGILQAHEALYYVAQQAGLDSSVEVRMVIRNLLMKNEDILALSKSVHELGSKFFWWEKVTGTYQVTSGDSGIFLTLSYDPMMNQPHMNYLVNFNRVVGATAQTEVGYFICEDQKYWSSCHTSNAAHTCTIQNFWFATNIPNDNNLELVCSDMGIDVQMTTRNDASAKPVTH